MSAIAWFGIIIAGIIALTIAYYVFFIAAKVFLTLLPIALILLVGGVIGWMTGGILGGVIFFFSIVAAFVVHDKWEGSDLYQKIEVFFDKKTTV